MWVCGVCLVGVGLWCVLSGCGFVVCACLVGVGLWCVLSGCGFMSWNKFFLKQVM